MVAVDGALPNFFRAMAALAKQAPWRHIFGFGEIADKTPWKLHLLSGYPAVVLRNVGTCV